MPAFKFRHKPVFADLFTPSLTAATVATSPEYRGLQDAISSISACSRRVKLKIESEIEASRGFQNSDFGIRIRSENLPLQSESEI